MAGKETKRESLIPECTASQIWECVWRGGTNIPHPTSGAFFSLLQTSFKNLSCKSHHIRRCPIPRRSHFLFAVSVALNQQIQVRIILLWEGKDTLSCKLSIGMLIHSWSTEYIRIWLDEGEHPEQFLSVFFSYWRAATQTLGGEDN